LCAYGGVVWVPGGVEAVLEVGGPDLPGEVAEAGGVGVGLLVGESVLA
jgi:hypothetical protein